MTALLNTMFVLAAEVGEPIAAPQQQAQRRDPLQAIWGLLPFILIIVVFFWLMSRSQKKRDRKRTQMLEDIRPRDDVVTIGGIRGRVVKIKGDEVVLRIDPEKDIKITIAKSGINRKLGEEEEQ